MEKIKEMFTKHGVENAELQSAVNELFDSAVSENVDDQTKMLKFQVKKALSQRDDAREQIIEFEHKVDQFGQKVKAFDVEREELGQYKIQVEQIQKQKTDANLESWNKRKEIFSVDESDKMFEKVGKVKERFAFGDELTPEQVAKNLDTLKIYDDVNYFSTENGGTHYSTKKPEGQVKPPTGEFGGYDSAAQMAWKDPKAYAIWRKDHR